jgi:tagatose 1,6-diphosphate aldolase
MTSLSLGKRRRLQQATSSRGTFTVLAIDHRGPLRRALAREVPDERVVGILAEVKRDIVRELSPVSSAVLLDPEVGLTACVTAGALPGSTGLVVALDTGSTGDPAVRQTGLVEGWDAARAGRAGAAGAKLLVYYHPEAAEAGAVEQLVGEVARACVASELPLYLEPLSFWPGQPGRGLPSEDRRAVVMETARRLVPLGVDVLKCEFPVETREQPDEEVWRGSCEELSRACAVPWVLLSAGVSFEVFLRQAEIACEAGASGVMAGRAVWAEAVTADEGRRRSFLRGTGRRRLEQLRVVCDSLARPLSNWIPEQVAKASTEA